MIQTSALVTVLSDEDALTMAAAYDLLKVCKTKEARVAAMQHAGTVFAKIKAEVILKAITKGFSASGEEVYVVLHHPLNASLSSDELFNYRKKQKDAKV